MATATYHYVLIQKLLFPTATLPNQELTFNSKIERLFLPQNYPNMLRIRKKINNNVKAINCQPLKIIAIEIKILTCWLKHTVPFPQQCLLQYRYNFMSTSQCIS